MLGKRQPTTVENDNDANGDGLWGYSTVSLYRYLGKKSWAHTGADRSSHQMGRRRCYPDTTRIMACLGTPACPTKDQTGSASDGISQSTNPEPPQRLYAEALQILVPRRQWAQSYLQPQFASNGPGWGGEGYPMQAYPPPGKRYRTSHARVRLTA